MIDVGILPVRATLGHVHTEQQVSPGICPIIACSGEQCKFFGGVWEIGEQTDWQETFPISQ